WTRPGRSCHDLNSCCCAIPLQPADAQPRQDARFRSSGAVGIKPAPARTTRFPESFRTPSVLPVLGGPPPQECQVTPAIPVKGRLGAGKTLFLRGKSAVQALAPPAASLVRSERSA